MKYYIALFVLIFYMFPCLGQEVWPGDVNNNGVVNAVDILYWGIAVGSTGEMRENDAEDDDDDEEDDSWQGEDLPENLWTLNFPNGVNYAYADCDGDGVVDEEDLEDFIEVNFGLTHEPISSDGFQNGQAGQDVEVSFSPNQVTVNPGANIALDLVLGTPENPVENFYGISLQLSFNPSLVESIDFSFNESSWVNNGENDAVSFFSETSEPGKAELTITRTNQQPIPEGEGPVGQFLVVIEDIIVGLESDTLEIKVDSVLMIDQSMNAIAAVPGNARVLVSNKVVSTQNTDYNPKNSIQVFPNPSTQSQIYFASQEPIESIQVFTILGEPVPIEIRLQNKIEGYFNLPLKRPGTFVVLIKTPKGNQVNRLILFDPD